MQDYTGAVEQGWEPGSYMALAGERQREGPLVLETPASSVAAAKSAEHSPGSTAAAAAAVAAVDEPWGPSDEGAAKSNVNRQASAVGAGQQEGAAAERGGGSSSQPA